MARTRTQVTLTLDPDNAKTIRAVGERLGLNFSEMIDRAIVRYLADHAKAELEAHRKDQESLKNVLRGD